MNEKLQLIRQEIERRQEDLESRNFHSIVDEYDDLLSFIVSLEDGSEHNTNLMRTSHEEQEQGYDPDCLQSCIDKAKKSWEGVDVDKFTDDVRGREPARDCHGLEEEIVRYFSENPVKNITDWPALKNTAIHFAEWQKKQDDKCLHIAYKAGKEMQKEQMMKDAVDAVFTEFVLRPFRLTEQYANPLSLRPHDKVKLIVIPQDHD